MKNVLIIGALLLLGAGCAKPMMLQAQKVSFTTSDDVTIVGNYVDAGKGAPHALLLHMMPATKESYAAFAEKLRAAGISSLAIDFRGHGESTRKSTDDSSQFTVLNYKKFSDAEQQAKILDVRAAVDWIEQNHGAKKEKLVFVGASIGANLAFQYLVENPEVPAVVLLSPGLDYRGIMTESLARAVLPNQSLYFAASKDDAESFEAIRRLAQVTPATHVLKTFQNAGHGTTMFEKEKGFMDELVRWVASYLK